ncbi:MAG: FMN-binding protein, partial [Lachnospiraceae bacterium]|nr:FMN-binding protein [Lachnospiraceae bacterium]
MKNIRKAIPILAPVLAAGAVAWGAASSLNGYTAPVYGADEFQIAGKDAREQENGQERNRSPAEESLPKGENDASESGEEEKAATKGNFDLADGSYEGSGNGFHGPVKVSVKILGKSISAVDVLSHSDDEAFFNRAKEGVIGNILSEQSLEVDVVSGATYSSKGIISAVKNALFKSADADDQGAESAKSSAADPVTIGQGNFNVADGAYEGSGQGYRGEVKVRVDVQSKTITAVDVLSHSDDESFFNRAREGVTASILSGQSLEVDAVSGATYSSRGIISAVKNALSGQEDGGENDVLTPSPTPKTIKKVKESGAYEDGAYTGTGAGFGGDITVRVKISGGKIKSIKILKSQDGDDYIQKASVVMQSILKQQGTNVDAVSGATYSSVGIIEAVRNALQKATASTKKKKPSATAAPGKKPQATAQPTKKPSNPSGLSGKFPYPDGTYKGVGEGFGGDIGVIVAIRDKAIKEIQITSHEDEDDAFFNRAKAVIDQVLQKQDIHVDAVSGATYSSRGILEGIANAIEAAKQAAEALSKPQKTPIPTETPKPTEAPVLTETPKPTESPLPTETPVPGGEPSGGVYADGEYTATALCAPDEYEDFEAYNLTLTLAVKDDRITEIRNIFGDGDSENDAYIRRAANGSSKYPGVVSQILEKNSVEGVDAVSHATCSSRSIQEACRQALENAKRQ